MFAAAGWGPGRPLLSSPRASFPRTLLILMMTMMLMMILAKLSSQPVENQNFGDELRCFVAKFTVTNLNKDFINTGQGGGDRFMKLF